ncbi:hypothetical protein O181_093814 [Austropuccinia psidii MF-1]|uniref:Uncharacterized protein n=1 Tax=Austropuccinia psidii MF-1 TaxID=1389203 RepID=A0A9Q3J1Y3_9BASI|nr:hypothetical protein [Austropuccinia psidii MF-1]
MTENISVHNSSCSYSNSKRSSQWNPSSSSTEGPLIQRTNNGSISRTTLKGLGQDDAEEEENSVEEEESYGTEAAPAPVGESQGNGGPTIAKSKNPGSHQYEPSLLAIMQKMTQIMANIQAA